MGCKALGETVVAVQWGPWREVGMAATKGTAARNFGRGWDGVKIERIRTNQIEYRIVQMMYLSILYIYV